MRVKLHSICSLFELGWGRVDGPREGRLSSHLCDWVEDNALNKGRNSRFPGKKMKGSVWNMLSKRYLYSIQKKFSNTQRQVSGAQERDQAQQLKP